MVFVNDSSPGVRPGMESGTKCKVCERWADSGLAASKEEAKGSKKTEVRAASVLIHRKGGKPPVPMCDEHLEDAQKSSADLIERIERL